ncbi:hypothetical protein Afil01_39610 [Actinorhabdospora filicis]|uniref:PqqD family protein n=1 Tax=Actinorhabdospora filicis TaxID=1785913 RepID=A0A9W6SLI2_9ACTN|nr:hypothetical protein [Actinorhabdospora filicis]GLZ79154.1 hypothetical protein Afil01_39610 [Actinorhabdospora filicis]
MAAADTLHRPLRMHHLTFLDEGEEVTVGRPDIDSYIHLPPDGAALLRRLSQGSTPAEVAEWYHAEYGETVDMADFLEAITDLGFVAAEGEEVAAAPRVKWQGLARVLFSKPAFAVYGLLIAGAVAATVMDPTLAPSYRNSFFHPSLLVVSLTLFIGQFPFLILHEGAHALSGRRLGLNSSLRFSRRLYFIVLETAMDGLVSVPRAKRFLPILAGAITDLVVTAVLTLTAAATTGIVRGICLAFALTTLMRLLWQCYFFLRTDLYYLVVTVLGCTNLHAVSRNLLHRRLAKLLRLKTPPTTPGAEADYKAARWYSWLLVVGYAAMLVSVITVVIPSTVYVVVEVFDRIDAGASAGMIADSIVVAVLILSQFVIAGALALRERLRNTTTLENPS